MNLSIFSVAIASGGGWGSYSWASRIRIKDGLYQQQTTSSYPTRKQRRRSLGWRHLHCLVRVSSSHMSVHLQITCRRCFDGHRCLKFPCCISITQDSIEGGGCWWRGSWKDIVCFAYDSKFSLTSLVRWAYTHCTGCWILYVQLALYNVEKLEFIQNMTQCPVTNFSAWLHTHIILLDGRFSCRPMQVGFHSVSLYAWASVTTQIMCCCLSKRYFECWYQFSIATPSRV